MKRLYEYKNLRKQRRKLISVMLFFLILSVSGIMLTDYCMNTIVRNENRINILHFENDKDSTLKINILNKVISLQYSGVINDFENMKNKLTVWSKNLFSNR